MNNTEVYETSAPAKSAGNSRAARLWHGMSNFVRRNPLSAFWGAVAAAVLIMAITAPLLAPHDPLKANFRRMSKPPDAQSYFGTDQIGRDNLSRVIHGSRSSLSVAIAAVVITRNFVQP